jgi:Plavaka transposase
MTDVDLRSRVQRLFHESMKIILEPLKDAGQNGVKIRNSEGEMRQIHPFLCCYVADYPEQCLISCTKSGTCPKCRQKANNLQSILQESARTSQWTKSIILDAKEKASDSITAFHRACQNQDVAGGTYDPFWSNLPYTDIHKAITPDILHQLYQGIFKHLVGWCQSIIGEKELDQHIRCLPYG